MLRGAQFQQFKTRRLYVIPTKRFHSLYTLLSQDEKALRFFSTIPRKWRLFWALEFIGISFSLALIAIYSIGNSFPLLTSDGNNLEGFRSWVIWVLNPAAVTMCSYRLSVSLQNCCESCSTAIEVVDPLVSRPVFVRAWLGLLTAMMRAKYMIRREPCFYAVLGVWLVHGVCTGWFHVFSFGPPMDFYFCLNSGFSFTTCVRDDRRTFALMNGMLVAGVVMKMLGLCFRRPRGVAAVQEPCRSSDEMGRRHGFGKCTTESRVPSLLVGLGVGYWVTALLFVLGSSWHQGGWDDAPTALSVVGYVVLPWFALLSIFMVADANVLGKTFGSFIKPGVEMLLDRRRTVYWVMVAVFREALLLWIILIVFVALEFSV